MLKILGDICFADGYFDRGCGVGTAIKNGADPFCHLERLESDFWIGNFECVCASENNQHFVITPDALSTVAHLDLYGVANNHSMQIGEAGYLQTIEFIESHKVKYVGSNSQRSICFSHQNKKVGIVAFSLRPDNFSDVPLYWHLPELCDIQKELGKLKDCDYKIAFVHWGYEFINYPNIEQKLLAHWLVDNGINLVAGMHPHVAQGCEMYKGAHIYYSLGNSVFNMPWESTKYGLLLSVDLSSDDAKVDSHYTQIGADGFPKIVDSVPEAYSRRYLDSLVTKNIENELYFAEARNFNNSYTKANRKAIIKRLLTMPMNEQWAIISDFVKRRFCKS